MGQRAGKARDRAPKVAGLGRGFHLLAFEQIGQLAGQAKPVVQHKGHGNPTDDQPQAINGKLLEDQAPNGDAHNGTSHHRPQNLPRPTAPVGAHAKNIHGTQNGQHHTSGHRRRDPDRHDGYSQASGCTTKPTFHNAGEQNGHHGSRVERVGKVGECHLGAIMAD
jgi:hypothetical protein